VASKTAIVCLHEGTRGHSIDPVFINKLVRTLKPSWIRWQGSNIVRLDPCGRRKDLIGVFPQKLREVVLAAGGDTTLMVWADVDDDMPYCDALKNEFWREAEKQGVTRDQFDQVVFVFAKDRIENWIEFLRTGATDESKEGPMTTARWTWCWP